MGGDRKQKRFTNLMKYELSGKSVKKRFSWALSEEKYLKIAEVRKLKRACAKGRDEALSKGNLPAVRDWFMVMLGLNTGLRVEEMRELSCGDLHIDRDDSSLSVRKGKGNRPRTVRISVKFRHDCKWFINWKRERGHKISPDEPLFTNIRGRHLSKRALQKAFKKCMQRAGLPGHYSIHSLRHTYATHLLKAGNYNLRLVQEQLGHSSVRITEVYTSLIDSDVKKAVERLYK